MVPHRELHGLGAEILERGDHDTVEVGEVGGEELPVVDKGLGGRNAVLGHELRALGLVRLGDMGEAGAVRHVEGVLAEDAASAVAGADEGQVDDSGDGSVLLG